MLPLILFLLPISHTHHQRTRLSCLPLPRLLRAAIVTRWTRRDGSTSCRQDTLSTQTEALAVRAVGCCLGGGGPWMLVKISPHFDDGTRHAPFPVCFPRYYSSIPAAPCGRKAGTPLPRPFKSRLHGVCEQESRLQAPQQPLLVDGKKSIHHASETQRERERTGRREKEHSLSRK